MIKHKLFNNKENELVETVDGRQFWISRSVAICGVVFAIVEDEKYVLAVLRGPDVSDSNKWCLPCGYLDWDESGAEAAYREIYEETGIYLRDIFRTTGHHLYENKWALGPTSVSTDPNKDDRQNVTLRYTAYLYLDELPDINKKPDGEVLEAQWVHVDEIESKDWAFNHEDLILDYLN